MKPIDLLYPRRILNKIRYWKIRYWLWWYFKATEDQKYMSDLVTTGKAYMINGKRINPRKILRKGK